MRIDQIKWRFQTGRLRLQRDFRMQRINRKIAGKSHPSGDQKPVIFFNASSRLGSFSQNAGFTLLSAWGLQSAGYPVIHFACKAGMSRCVLGTNPDNIDQSPPCENCVSQSNRMYASAPTIWFEYEKDELLSTKLQALDVGELSTFVYEFQPDVHIPLGEIVLPSVRWILRRHHLVDDAATRRVFREYILSAYWIAHEFDQLISKTDPSAVILFNGLQYPESTVKWAAKNRGKRVITHEVSFQPFSAFFTDGEATIYPIEIPDDFQLSESQNAALNSYLSSRFKGEFTMAGIRFWPEMVKPDEAFQEKAKGFKQIVSIFANVVFDTSQAHANTVFSDMFDWLDLVKDLILENADTLFVLRAHPDEKRVGKESRETVSDWVEHNQLHQVENLVFIDSSEPLSSYDLIQSSKFVMVYNSSIGMEATFLGVPVLCGGKARYTQYPIVFFPDTAAEYREKADKFLAAEIIDVPEDFIRNARRFLYYQLFKVSLPFGEYIEAHPTPGYVQLKRFHWSDLTPLRSETTRALVRGLERVTQFELEADDG